MTGIILQTCLCVEGVLLFIMFPNNCNTLLFLTSAGRFPPAASPEYFLCTCLPPATSPEYSLCPCSPASPGEYQCNGLMYLETCVTPATPGT